MNKWINPIDAKNLINESVSDLINIKKIIHSREATKTLDLEINLAMAKINNNLGLYENNIKKEKIYTETFPYLDSEKHHKIGAKLDLLSTKAKSYASIGKFSKAFKYNRKVLKAYNRLLEVDPGNDEWLYRKCLILKELGFLHLSINDYDGAKDKLEPAHAISSNNIKKINGVNTSESHWTYLVANIELDLMQLEFDRIDAKIGNHNQNLVLLSEQIKIKLGKIDTSYLPYRVLYNKLLILSSKVYNNCFYKEANNCVNPHEEINNIYSKYLEDIQVNDSDVDIIKNNIFLGVQISDLLVTLSDYIETNYNNEKPTHYFEKSISVLDRLYSNNKNHLILIDKIANIYTLLGKSYEKRGYTGDARGHYKKAFELYSKIVDKNPENYDYRRKKASAMQTLAKNLSDALVNEKSFSNILNLFQKSHDIWKGLDDDGFLRVEDRLSAAHALYLKGMFYIKNNKKNEGMKTLTYSSDLGSISASKFLYEYSENFEYKSKYKLLISEQERLILQLPVYLEDHLEGNTDKKVKRRFFTKVVITKPVDNKDKNKIWEEEERLNFDQMVSIEPKLVKEINHRVNHLTNNVETLSMPVIVQNALLSYNQKNSKSIIYRGPVQLRSPIINKYPKTTPTIIGHEIRFSWDYNAIFNNEKKFRLQVRTDKSNEIILDKEIKGDHYLFSFSKEQKKYLNQKLHWRVADLSYIKPNNKNINGSGSGSWSLERPIEIYESIWKRILHTGKLRIGVTQYDGDLLKLNEEDPNQLEGFDGEVVNNILSRLSKPWNRARSELIPNNNIPFNFKDKLELDVIVYGWNGMFDAVTRNEVDFALSTITRTFNRENRFDIKFSEPYYETQLAILYRKPSDSVKEGILINSVDDLLDIKLIANEGFRGAEIGRLIAGRNLETESFRNLKLLVSQVLTNELTPAAITDHVFLEQYFKNKPDEREKVGIFPITSDIYRKLLEKSNSDQSETKEKFDITKLLEMENDYGSIEWEQYAAATNTHDNGIFLGHLNQAILSIRKEGILQKLIDDATLHTPSPSRLTSEHQKLESERQLATVIPLKPSYLSEDRLYQLPMTIMGEHIEFTWKPLDFMNKDNAEYRIQVSNSLQFNQSSILFEDFVEGTGYKLKPKLLHNSNDFKGKLYWRAKRLDNKRIDEKDLFPQDGWCNPVSFEYYKDSIDRIKHTNKLIVGVTISNGYSVYKDNENKLEGFDVEIINYITGYLVNSIGLSNVEIEYIPIDFTNRFPKIKNHQIDLAISGITKTIEREKKHHLRFSEPYAETRQAAIWRHDDTSITKVSDLVNKNFIVVEKTRAHDVAKRITNNIKTTLDKPKMYLLGRLQGGQADATIADYPTAIKLVEQYEKENPDQKFKIGVIDASDLPKENIIDLTDDFFIDLYAIPIQKDQDGLMEIVNSAIMNLRTKDINLLRQFFAEHQNYDSSRFLESPFAFEFQK